MCTTVPSCFKAQQIEYNTLIPPSRCNLLVLEIDVNSHKKRDFYKKGKQGLSEFLYYVHISRKNSRVQCTKDEVLSKWKKCICFRKIDFSEFAGILKQSLKRLPFYAITITITFFFLLPLERVTSILKELGIVGLNMHLLRPKIFSGKKNRQRNTFSK